MRLSPLQLLSHPPQHFNPLRSLPPLRCPLNQNPTIDLNDLRLFLVLSRIFASTRCAGVPNYDPASAPKYMHISSYVPVSRIYYIYSGGDFRQWNMHTRPQGDQHSPCDKIAHLAQASEKVGICCSKRKRRNFRLEMPNLALLDKLRFCG
jgi:hypothetical protein